MRRKKIKYNLIILFLVVLVGAYIGMGVISNPLSRTQLNVGSNNDAEAEEPLQPDDSSVVVGDDLPTDAIGLVNYALNIYNDGLGSHSTFQFDILCNGKASLGSLSEHCGLQQHSSGEIFRNGNESLQEEYYYYDNIWPSEYAGFSLEQALIDVKGVKWGYRAINVDPDNDSVICVETNKASKADLTYDLNDDSGKKETFSYAEGKERFAWIYSDRFPLEISDQTVRVKEFDRRSSPQYYVIKLEYVVNKLPEILNMYYQDNFSLEQVNYTNYEFTFYISKKTGSLWKIVRKENYTSVRKVLVKPLKQYLYFNFDLTTNYVQTFKSLGKEVKIRKPYLEYTKPEAEEEQKKE